MEQPVEKIKKIKFLITDAMLDRLDELLTAGVEDKHIVCAETGIPPQSLQAALFKLTYRKIPKMNPVKPQKPTSWLNKTGNYVVDKSIIAAIEASSGKSVTGTTPTVVVLPDGKLLVTFA